ncbi:Complement component 1 Q subcomponent-binding protein, mitochondrial [Oryzias melastigma]|uniref:Complement component 1 Q subcomponent-binding protein, mitochondrial n=1 Tax=Oryzias melastigma TaxID=30732 RepID=A0A3B3BVU5_ORYME|nr:complement component 1 Q subcomponent-binding protein, mitochondrial [Oryzias melastigma]KAF6738511.1 Complement component 1 Q subcomponent-binding protein, mitochondrial [Oryzias melastigma]
MLKSLVRAAGAAVRLSSAPSAAARVLPLSCPTIRSPGSVGSRPFTRSLWMLNSNGASSGYRPKLFSSKILSPSVSCGCGGLHTEGDKAFGNFLSDEIKEEKKIQKNKTLPKMSGGWELEMNGTEAKLTRHLSGEKVTVTFNVNNSIPPSFEEEEQQQKSAEEEPEIVSTPNFVVEVTKQNGKQTLVFDCHFPEDEISHGEGEEESDIFAIREVSFQPEGDSDWKETSYTLNTDSLDWALYDHLMDFLADRGVDNTFTDELMELSTAIEHQEYIKFLEDLQGFVKCN